MSKPFIGGFPAEIINTVTLSKHPDQPNTAILTQSEFWVRLFVCFVCPISGEVNLRILIIVIILQFSLIPQMVQKMTHSIKVKGH